MTIARLMLNAPLRRIWATANRCLHFWTTTPFGTSCATSLIKRRCGDGSACKPRNRALPPLGHVESFMAAIARKMMTTDTESKQLPARLQDVADVMLAETASSNPLLRFKKGKYFFNDNEIEVGHEYIAYPF